MQHQLETRPDGPALQTLKPQGGPHLQGGPHFDCRKIEEAMLTFTKLFVLPGLSPPYVMFHITEILAWIYLRRICLKIRNNL